MTATCGLCDRALEHGYLCPGDTLALAGRLTRLPAAYKALGAFLAPTGHAATEHVSSGHAAPPLPVNETVLDLRYGGIALVVEGWLSAVQEARGWGQPAIGGTVEDRVRRAARSLHANLEWASAEWPAAGDLAAEIRDLERDVLSIVNPLDPRDRARRLGYCPTVLDDGQPCGAVVKLPPASATAECTWCGSSWAPSRWLELRAAQGVFEDESVASNPGIRVG